MIYLNNCFLGIKQHSLTIQCEIRLFLNIEMEYLKQQFLKVIKNEGQMWPLGHPTTNNNKHVIRQRFLGKYIGYLCV
jgi:hypothetical protein